MIEKRTVFILGAGASCPYGFPTARGLREMIIGGFVSAYGRLLDERKKLGLEGINKSCPHPVAAGNLVTRFKESSTESIDLFLSRHPQCQEIGKTAICLSILEAERLSHFRENVKDATKDWYFHLFNKLTRELTGKDDYQEFAKNNIAFVTFNYDRSLEHFLFTSLLHSFEGANAANVCEQICQVPIIHVYGQVAPLQPCPGDEASGLAYANEKKVEIPLLNFPTLINNVFVVHEERTNPQMEKAREEISKADRLFFLGFGYAKENLEALGLPDALRPMHRIYGTAMGWTQKEIEAVRFYLGKALGRSEKDTPNRSGQVYLRNCDCVALLREFL